MNPTAQQDNHAAPYLSVVIPCYNEADGVAELHRRVSAACTAFCEPRGCDYELVLINDGSRDLTWPKIVEFSNADPHLIGVNLSRNHGHQLALTAGLSICRGRRILILDADLQDPPELLPEMSQIMDGGADVVYGKRKQRAGETFFKRASAAVFYRIITKLTETKIPEDTGDFRLMSRRALDVLMSMPERHRFIRGMVSWIGFRQEPLLYDRDPRYAGETKYPLRKMIRFALDAVTAFSVKPLALASIVGLCTGALALIILAYALVSWLSGRTVSGWTSQVGVIALLGSVQLFVLGIIGEYLGRLYEQSKGRPLFIIEQIVRSNPAPTQPQEARPERLEVTIMRDVVGHAPTARAPRHE